MTNCTCERCNGKGWLEQFKNTNGGECFKCNGTGIVGGTVKLPRPKWKTYHDEIALKNAFTRINEERKARNEQIKKANEEFKKYQEEIENEEFEPFTW